MWSVSRDGRLDQIIVFKFLDREYVPVGLLKMEGNGTRRQSRFAYADSYMRRGSGRPVDPVGLPLGRKWRPSNPEEVYLSFQDSGPDGWGKGVLNMAFPALRLGMPEYLALGGLSRTGDLAYGPTPQGTETWRPTEPPLLRLPDDADDIEALLAAAKAADEGDPSADHLALLFRTSADVGGARPKARFRHKGTDWIAKFPSWSDRIDDPKLEAVCLDVAAASGVETPEHDLLTIRNRSVLLVKRFDRDADERPLAYLSAGTLLNESSTAYGTNKTYADIAEVGRRIGASGTAKELFKRFLLNSYLHNTDDHLRNHAFVDSGAGWRLSPVFDVVPHLGASRHVCAPVAGFSPEWNPPVAFASHHGFRLGTAEAEEVREDVTAAIARLDEFMESREVSRADRDLIRSALASKGVSTTKHRPADPTSEEVTVDLTVHGPEVDADASQATPKFQVE